MARAMTATRRIRVARDTTASLSVESIVSILCLTQFVWASFGPRLRFKIASRSFFYYEQIVLIVFFSTSDHTL